MVGWLKGFSRGPVERLTKATATLGQDMQCPTRDLSLTSPEHKSTTLLLHQSAQWCDHRVRVCLTEIAVMPLNYQIADCVLWEQMRGPHSMRVRLILDQTYPDNFMKRGVYLRSPHLMKKLSTVVCNRNCRWHYQNILPLDSILGEDSTSCPDTPVLLNKF